jgi:hypothetical protein
MSKTWGPHCWHLFHTLARRVNDNEFQTIKYELWNTIFDVCKNLPCPDCREHATKLMDSAKKQLILSSKKNLELFLFDFHNLVNKRKKYKNYTIEEYNQKYDNININSVIHNFILAFSHNILNIRQMTDNFQRNIFLDGFKSWIIKNYSNFS